MLATKPGKHWIKVSTGFHCTNITADKTQRPKEQNYPNIKPYLTSTTVLEVGIVVKVTGRDEYKAVPEFDNGIGMRGCCEGYAARQYDGSLPLNAPSQDK